MEIFERLDGKSVITVVVDILANYAHFCDLSHPFRSSVVTTSFVETFQKLHGNPKIKVSDRYSIFIEIFWIELLYFLVLN